MTGDESKNVPKAVRQGHRFAPGNPGGPGRPQGSRNAASLMLDRLADGEAAEILANVIAKAKDGDLKAAELILARAWPQRKGRPVALNLPPIESAMDVLKGLGAVVAAMGDGTITPDEAALVGGLLEAKRKALETVTIEERLTKLEGLKK